MSRLKMIVHLLTLNSMSPRPRETSDEAILQATARAIARHGPARLTLGRVAAEVGVAPATLMQRFGSKRGLLLAWARQGAGSAGQEYAAIRAAHASPLAALFAVADCMAGMAPTPQELANHLAFLNIDLTDPDFHQLSLEHALASRKEVQSILDAAVQVGELVPCDTGRLARLVGAVMGGGLLGWAIERKGTAAEWLREDLETLVEPYRRRRKRKRSGAKG
jgi:AcrR family transcriptional regulator